LRKLDPLARLDRVVRSLQTAHIAAIAVQGAFAPETIDAARSAQVAFFQLPSSIPLSQIERSVIRLIVDRTSYLAQRSAELQRELNQIALDGGGLDKIARHIHSFVQQPVVVLKDDGQVATGAGLNGYSDSQRQLILNALPNIMTLRSWTATQPAAKLNQVVGCLRLATTTGGADSFPYREAVVTAIVAGESLRGYCLLLRPTAGQDISAVEEIAALEGASAAALEWAKQNAVGIAEERMRATFLDEMLASEIADEQAWIQRGASLGYDLTRPHVAWLIETRGIPDWPVPLLPFLEEREARAPYSRREEGMLLFWPIDNPKSGRELKSVAGELVTQLLARHPQADLVIGIARPAVSPA